MLIQPLNSIHRVRRFDSGNQELNVFLRRYALKNQEAGLGTTYVVTEDEREILGYVTLVSGQISGDQLPAHLARHLPRYPIPILRLGRLAVSGDAQGRGIGGEMLRFTFQLALEQSVRVGCWAVATEPKPGAESYYERYGFIRLISPTSLDGSEGAVTYVLPLATLRAAQAGPLRLVPSSEA